jgi:hypothetical protein
VGVEFLNEQARVASTLQLKTYDSAFLRRASASRLHTGQGMPASPHPS